MTVGELIEELEQHEPDAEVRIAFQPSWPLRANVAAVTGERDSEDPEDGEDPEGGDLMGGFVWIAATASVSGDENPYAPKAAWNGGGW